MVDIRSCVANLPAQGEPTAPGAVESAPPHRRPVSTPRPWERRSHREHPAPAPIADPTRDPAVLDRARDYLAAREAIHAVGLPHFGNLPPLHTRGERLAAQRKLRDVHPPHHPPRAAEPASRAA